MYWLAKKSQTSRAGWGAFLLSEIASPGDGHVASRALSTFWELSTGHMYEKCLAAGARYREGKFHSVILTVVTSIFRQLSRCRQGVSANVIHPS